MAARRGLEPVHWWSALAERQHGTRGAARAAPAEGARADAVVVGGGNSAVQIAAELGAVTEVALATRRPLGWLPRRRLGRDLHWWLKRTGGDIAPLGRWLHRLPVSVLDDGHWRAALAEHGVDRREMFTRSNRQAGRQGPLCPPRPGCSNTRLWAVGGFGGPTRGWVPLSWLPDGCGVTGGAAGWGCPSVALLAYLRK
ncbi:hypothetical protein [Streptomyces carminius]|uniref:hypothetical protein n=1 Tax=Streptomyces carminius TaxID=2665496 RepID=UPI002FCE439B